MEINVLEMLPSSSSTVYLKEKLNFLQHFKEKSSIPPHQPYG